MKPFVISRQAIHRLSRFNGRLSSPNSTYCRNFYAIAASISQSHRPFNSYDDFAVFQNPVNSKPIFLFNRYFHYTRETRLSESSVDSIPDSDDSNEAAEVGDQGDDGTTNEFLSRFVWIMRGKVSEAYPDFDKKTIDDMLLLIVQKVVEELEKGGLEQMLGSALASPSQDFSEDLWKTVWEVSNTVLKDMKKERKKERMKQFLQSEEVKEMCRFSGEVGIRGDLLRELRFKWAREKMEESEFYESLEQLREESKAEERAETEVMGEEEAVRSEEEKLTAPSLPKRKGKIKYKIYGLDLSDKKWVEVADKIHEAGEIIWPQEPKPVSGKCKLVTEKLLSLKEEDDPSALLAEWAELLQPNRVDWMALLDQLQENNRLYLKVAELVLDEKSFQANIRDYSKLIDAHAKENRLEEAERLLEKMNQNGMVPDLLTATVLVHMYSKSGNLDQAKEAFDSLRSYGFQPDVKVYNSMIMAYVRAGQPKLGESLMREMEARDIKPSEEIYMALLRSFAQQGDVSGSARISTTMQFAGIQQGLESCTLLVEAYGKAGDPDQARSSFDYLIKVGHKPDDRCIASMIQAYEKKNLLDKALNLLLQLEKDRFEFGANTYTVLVDWMGKLGLIDEAEQLLGKISQQGEAPPFKIHVSLCDMYSRAKNEKKTLQTLQVLEAKKDQLGSEDYETIISGLITGGFMRDAKRMHGLMSAQGHSASEKLNVALMASQVFSPKKQGMR